MTDDEELLVGIGLLYMLTMMDTIDWGGGWVVPVPDMAGPRAMISNGFVRPTHLGVDLLYHGTLGYYAPDGLPVVAARAGKVWSTGVTERGHNVVVDHGAPFATFYQHLARVDVAKGQEVKAGDQLGLVGADPTDAQHIRHLHFAVWYKGNGDSASVDPAAAMASWRRVLWTP